MTPDEIITQYVNRLRQAGARNVDEYEELLRQNAGNAPNLKNYLSEAVAAFMLLDQGAEVTMQDRPDLAAVLKGEKFYAEVKHFNRKTQDSMMKRSETPQNSSWLSLKTQPALRAKRHTDRSRTLPSRRPISTAKGKSTSSSSTATVKRLTSWPSLVHGNSAMTNVASRRTPPCID